MYAVRGFKDCSFGMAGMSHSTATLLKKDGCCLRRSCSVGRSNSVVNCSFSGDAACTEKLYLLVKDSDRHRQTDV